MKKIYIILSLLWCCLINAQQLSPDTIINRLWQQIHIFPQEKIYLHTDKNEYIAGEKMWIKAYVVNATTHQPDTVSRYIYAEIISPLDQIAARVCFRRDSLQLLHGSLQLNDTLPGGKYTLRAYTRYMQNLDESYFFKKQIRIISPMAKEPSLPSTIQEEYDVAFLPEGGQLVEGVLCKVAFKSINAHGYGEDISGVILNDKQDTITTFSSLYKGMGAFSFIPQTGMQYIARYTNSAGKMKESILPKAEQSKYALQITRKKDDFYVSVLHSSNKISEPIFLVVHQRGLPRYAQIWDSSLRYLKFSETDFSSGIINFLITDLYGNVISERLAFKLPSKAMSSVRSDCLQYTPRQKVQLELQATDEQGMPWEGTASIAVTDNADVYPDSCNSIISNLLLTSELKGFIENPNWYFQYPESTLKREAIDILMLTQGWRRYDISQILKGKNEIPELFPETSMSITGTVTSSNKNKATENINVSILSPKLNLLKNVTTDNNGKFSLQGLEFADTIDFWVSIPKESMKRNTKLSICHPPIPSAHSLPISHFKTLCPDNKRELNYLQKTKNRITYEQGIRHIYIDEVTITASRKKYQTEYERFATRVITEEKIQKNGSPTIEGVISSFIGRHLLNNSQLVFDGVLCELKENAQYILQTLPPSDIQQIDIIKPPATIGFFNVGANTNLIFITTKRGYTHINKDNSPNNMIHFNLTGYTSNAEFYSPQYDRKQEDLKQDLRTTIYWKPDLKFSNGKANVTFYTADTPSTYTIIAEGISNNGYTLRVTGEINLNFAN